jgi:hypothetical protein
VSTHAIEVYFDTSYLDRISKMRPVTDADRDVAYSGRIICSDPAGCPGWMECREPHEVDGKSADEGPWEADETDLWDGLEEFEFHGKWHQWQSGYGWTVEYPRCPVQASDADLPDDIPRDRPGIYPVEVEWDDDLCTLTLIGESE